MKAKICFFTTEYIYNIWRNHQVSHISQSTIIITQYQLYLIESEKKIHQSMKAKICFFTTEPGKETKFLKAICLFQFRVNNSKTNFISHVNVKSR